MSFSLNFLWKWVFTGSLDTPRAKSLVCIIADHSLQEDGGPGEFWFHLDTYNTLWKSISGLKCFFLISFFLAGHHHPDAPEDHIQSEYIFTQTVRSIYRNSTLMLIC